METKPTPNKVLIVYGTKEGQTAKIADRIGEVFRARGYETDISSANDFGPCKNVSLQDYSAIIVGGSIHVMHLPSSVTRFIKHYKSDLERLPSAFYSVSLTDAGTESHEQLDKLLMGYWEKMGWQPKIVGRFGGALRYSSYGFLKRYMMRWIAQKGGYSTDVKHDSDYTDWDSVTQFANDFMARFEGYGLSVWISGT
jgi:menaquinone-dependent protoporphyrinogen oxidase